MRKLLIILFFLPCLSYSQNIKVNCGKDTIFCRSIYLDTTIRLGTQVKIINGEAPFTYKWSCRYVIDNSIIFTARSFLNDTTLLNPYFKSFPLGRDRLLFNLTVEDIKGKQASDSIIVQFSQFGYSLGYFSFQLNAGDSIQFGDLLVGGGIKPLKFYWTPSAGLSDSAINYPWCKPLKSNDYYQLAIDSVGCKSELTKVYSIKVIPTLIKTILDNSGTEFRSCQVGSKIVFDNSLNLTVTVTLYTLDGKRVLQSETKGSSFDLGQFTLQSKMYLYKLDSKDKSETGKFLNLKTQ